jgi:hypothetical protein
VNNLLAHPLQYPDPEVLQMILQAIVSSESIQLHRFADGHSIRQTLVILENPMLFSPTMSNQSYQNAIKLIDQANNEDPNRESWNGSDYPKELLYSERMSAWLEKLRPDASDLLKIAARAQHICRWMIPRNQYPKTRVGYLEWRTGLYSFHAEKAATIMAQCGYDEDSIKKVKRILKKRGLKKDQDAQTIEDVACLVFLESYFNEFVHEYGDEEKIISIVQKTWNKMSLQAQEAALGMKLADNAARIVQKALAEN